MALPLALFVAAFLYLNRAVIGQPPFFDEMWRIDFIYAGDTLGQYFKHNTPIPIAWLYLNKFIMVPLDGNMAALRTAAAIWAGLAGLVLAWRYSRPGPDCSPGLVAAGLVLPLCAVVQTIARSVGQYPFEMFHSVALLCVALRVAPLAGRGFSTALAFAIVAATPSLALGSIFFLPPVLLAMLWRSRNGRERLAVCVLAAATAGLAFYMHRAFYAPVTLVKSTAALSEFWREHIVQGDLHRFIQKLPFEIGVSLWGDGPIDPRTRRLTGLAVIGFGLLGASSIWRDSRTTFWVMLGAIASAGLVATATNWPMALGGIDSRLNLGWLWVFFAAFWAGCFDLLRRIGLHRCIAAALLVVLAAVPLAKMQAVPDAIPFRNLYRDIRNGLPALEPGALVVQFHPMAHFYQHYLLARAGKPHADLLRESDGDAALFRQVNDTVRDRPDIGTIWIVMPYESGPGPWEKLEVFVPDGFSKSRYVKASGGHLLSFRRNGSVE